MEVGEREPYGERLGREGRDEGEEEEYKGAMNEKARNALRAHTHTQTYKRKSNKLV